MAEIIESIKFPGEMTIPRIIAGVIILILLLIATYSDNKTRIIPKYCSYPIMLISLFLMIIEKQYGLALIYVLGVFGTGSIVVRGLMMIAAVVLYANQGAWIVPFVTGIVLGDIFFSLGLIGGGDAQLLYGMIAYGYRGWGLLILVAAYTIIVGIISVIRGKKSNNVGRRLKEIIKNLKEGKVKQDASRLTIPFAFVLCLSGITYALVQALF